VNTEPRLAGVCSTMLASFPTGKKLSNGKLENCKNDSLKRAIWRVMRILVTCSMVGLPGDE
jgi:hypothetical protein